MSEPLVVEVPDIGDFHDVEVIEVLVGEGDEITPEQPLITLESDKASMEVPSPRAGRVVRVRVALGDRVSAGSPIVELEPLAGEVGAPAEPVPAQPAASEPAAPPGAAPGELGAPPPAAPSAGPGVDIEAEVVVLGAGPGGYTAAFRAADLGLRTVLVERYPTLGGVCLNVGCIPSKALLHAAAVIEEAGEMGERGVRFGAPEIDPARLAAWKDRVVGQLTKGLAGLARQRKVQVIEGRGRFASSHVLEVEGGEGVRRIGFAHAIIAAGSRPATIPGFPHDDPRVMDSTAALRLEEVPERLLVVGGGIIGLEMATVYHALGSTVCVVELLDQLIPGCDPDLVRPLHKRLARRYEGIWLGTRVAAMEARKKGIEVRLEGPKAPERAHFDRVLVAVGRRPNGALIGAENAGVAVDEAGFIAVDGQQRSNVAHILAIGDVTGAPMLAHKATHQGKVAAEVCAGLKSAFEARAIPAVAYTDPEIAWTGLTEGEAGERGIEYDKATFPWAASGRALGIGRGEGLTKLIFEKGTRRLLGAGICGPHAGELIAEATLAIEMGADAEDLALTVHPHPTLSETLNFAAEMAEGTITDLYVPKRR